MIVLYTPATGFPDLEIKIAYGLARVGIEAGCEPEIIPQNGFYQVNYKTYVSDKIKQTFLIILNRLLSSDRFFDLGVKAKDKKKYPANEESIKHIQKTLEKVNFDSLFSLRGISNFNFKKKTFCGHEKIRRFGGRTGLILLSSFHAGKPYFRDKIYDKFNLNLCEICGYLAVLGLNSFCFNIQMGGGKNKKYVIVLPLPNKKLETKDLQLLLALQKTLHNFWLSDIQPLKTFIIGLLAKVPSLSDIVNDLQLYFHLSLVSKDRRGDTVVEQTAIVNAIPFSEFISNSSYNSATINKLLGSSKVLPKVASLIEITNILEHRKRDNLLKFARLYIQETSSFLYPETAKYLLKEVVMIDSKIIENPALKSLARTLRYFIRERKYSYADDIRNARKESRDFEDTIAKMLREGRLRLEQKEKIHLPTDEEIKEIFRLANQDFEATKTALVILAFSFPSKVEETIEIKEEV
ncbi:MAG TPA: type I-A CRISPR-associated protein Csa5 [Candidatus Desulfofervidus auxilii]|uniref:Type I-A CRISPR-associated protein Csa5 n=1 Tax=Desulfofervidus auxilii TaxID=1621989 RepID=A0A7C0U3Z5_DESA2|nr:type I-A CRISPR-associated protein Csa5 [Candidatus Desulfofervidus auxilii]